MIHTKVCCKCQKELPIINFSKNSGAHGYRKTCNPCRSLKNKDYTSGHKNSQLKKYYGITIDDYNDMFLQQSGCCKICTTHQSKLLKALSVDHCHKTGKIRGLLCGRCNMALGQFKDSFELCLKASKYLLENL